MATIEVNPSSFFVCPVCMEDIDDSWKMLPACQHVFCLDCLRKIYERTEENQNPKCPTCRAQIGVSLETLQKPRFLYEMYEHMRVSTTTRGGPICTTDGGLDDRELIDTFEQQSIDDDLLEEQEDVVGDDDEYLQIGDLVAAIELSILENVQQSPSNPSALANEVSDHGTVNSNNVIVDEEASDHGTANSNNVIVDDDDDDEEPSAHDISIIGDGTNANVPVSLSNFNNYLTANGNEVLNTILNVVSDEEKLNSLELTEIFAYVKTIDLHLEASEICRRQQIYKIIEEFGGEAGERILTRVLALESQDDNEDDSDANENTISDDDEDVDLIADLLEVLKQEKKDDAVLKVAQKKSEILDPIRTLQVQLVVIKKKLENVLVNIAVELENRSQATADLHTFRLPIPQLPPTLIPPTVAHSPPPPPPRFESSSPSSTPIEQIFPAIQSLILTLASNSIRYSSSSSSITNRRRCPNINLSSQRARTNTSRGSARDNRGGILSGNCGSSVSGSRGGSTKSCDSSASCSRGGVNKSNNSSASGSRAGSSVSRSISIGSRAGTSGSCGDSIRSRVGTSGSFGISIGSRGSSIRNRTCTSGSRAGSNVSRGSSIGSRTGTSGSRAGFSGSCGSLIGSRAGTSGSRAGSNVSRGSSIGSRTGFSGSCGSLIGSRAGTSGSRAETSGSRAGTSGSRAGSSGSRGSLTGSRAGSSKSRGSSIESHATFSINLSSSISGNSGSRGCSGVRIIGRGSRGGHAGRASRGRK